MQNVAWILGTLAVLATLSSCNSNDAGPVLDEASRGAGPTTAESPTLLFTIGMHIEPVGPTAQMPAAQGGQQRGDYNTADGYNRAVADIQAVVDIVEAHGGKLSVQAQSPFTVGAVNTGSAFLGELEDAGHEIGLHFHEDAHLGKNGDQLPVEQWCAVMTQEIELIKKSGVEHVEYWSGGNLYPALLEAAECAGLSVNSDWKNPQSQSTQLELVGTLPWRPAGGSNGDDVSQFAQHDPEGAIVFLPEGQYDRSDFASMRRSEAAGGDEAYFAYLAESLRASLAAAEPGKVNVFHFTVHPGEFRGNAADPYGVIARFLTDVVDPLVAEGKVAWATFSEMAAAFEEWEQENPGVDPRETTDAPAPVSTTPDVAAPTPAGRASKTTSSVTPSMPGVEYCQAGGESLTMDVYAPAGGAKKSPAVLFVHGGGWTAGSNKGGTGFEMIPELTAKGFVVASVNYRLAPGDKFPAQIEDVKCAVRHLRANAATYGIDPDHIGAYGGSAGGHLVALLGVTDGDEGLEGSGGYAGVSSRVQAVVDMFGPADLTAQFDGANQNIMTNVFGVTSKQDPRLKLASPVTHVSADDPPFLILHGDKDALVPLSQSQILTQKLQAAGVDAKLVVVRNAGHGFAPAGGEMWPSRDELTERVVGFFSETLK